MALSPSKDTSSVHPTPPDPSELEDRIDYGGEWWMIKTALTVGQEREYFDVLQSIGAAVGNGDGENGPDTEALAVLEARMRSLILACTVSWSYGAVDLDTLDSHVYGEHFRLTVDRMREYYAPLVVKAVENSVRIYSLRSNQEDPSPMNSTNPI